MIRGMMKGQTSYMPPPYIPLEQQHSDASADADSDMVSSQPQINDAHASPPSQWSSGICACFDDLHSCYIGLFCPCFLIGKNADFLGSGTLMGSCMTHFILWTLVNTICCLLTEGILLGLPGCFVACYACGYRRALRSKYNLQEAPCRDFVTHFFCHLCALCQEYREIRERSGNSTPPDLNLVEVTAPTLQKMEPDSH